MTKSWHFEVAERMQRKIEYTKKLNGLSRGES